jgi:4-aminobutyrate aminotransferase
MENGLLLLSCGLYGNILRVLAPLTISNQTLHEGLDILETSIRQAAKKI